MVTKKVIFLIFLICPFVLGDPCDPLYASKEEKETKNKAIILEYLKEAYTEPQNFPNAVRKYSVANGYVQHNPSIPDGREEFIDFVMAGVTPTTKNPILYLPRIAADGDFVWFHIFVRRMATAQLAVIANIFRLECGLIAEHWDVSQTILPNATYANSHPFF